jgi:hypothetical protein
MRCSRTGYSSRLGIGRVHGIELPRVPALAKRLVVNKHPVRLRRLHQLAEMQICTRAENPIVCNIRVPRLVGELIGIPPLFHLYSYLRLAQP